MKKILIVCLSLVIVCFVPSLYAGEHGGKEHGGKEHGGSTQEHGGTKVTKPSGDQIKKAMQDHVANSSKKTGSFEILDPVTNKKRSLKLQRVHDRVGKTGNYYYSCADFIDIASGELLDLDIDVEHKGGKLNAVDVRIHKVAGKARYTYDKNDNRIPLK